MRTSPRNAAVPDSQLSDARAIDGRVAALALAGLSQPQKTLPPVLFYDEAGCRLFQRITDLPEYYLTRTERALLATIAPTLAAGCAVGTALVEYGASDEGKARFLLTARDATGNPAIAAYAPIDVAAPALARLRRRLRRARPDLLVVPIVADFTAPIVLPEALAGLPRFGFFPGSTIGNLDPAGAQRFLAQAHATLGPGAKLLVGADLRKDQARLIAAYDDAAGVTAAFNRNLLVRLNREAAATFDPDGFVHRAVWNAAMSRIEMHLVSRLEQTVHVGGTAIHFRCGEWVHTENSYKYSAEDFSRLAEAAGWRVANSWTDAARLFALHLLAPP